MPKRARHGSGGDMPEALQRRSEDADLWHVNDLALGAAGLHLRGVGREHARSIPDGLLVPVHRHGSEHAHRQLLLAWRALLHQGYQGRATAAGLSYLLTVLGSDSQVLQSRSGMLLLARPAVRDEGRQRLEAAERPDLVLEAGVAHQAETRGVSQGGEEVGRLLLLGFSAALHEGHERPDGSGIQDRTRDSVAALELHVEVLEHADGLLLRRVVAAGAHVLHETLDVPDWVVIFLVVLVLSKLFTALLLLLLLPRRRERAPGHAAAKGGVAS
mmetsp:Transcript_74422/g.222033  ORF Transcript_74422/g.222033 Transcript_74422/m.222033 type:complete len:272 (+) Transcript_74422:27-842(+)